MSNYIKMHLQLFNDGAESGVSEAAAVSQDSVAVAQDTTTVQEEQRDLNADFEKLIRGEYKEQYNKRVQDTVRKRMKGTQETVDKYNAMIPLMELLGSKYGTTDVAALTRAVEEDNGLWEQEAAERGVSADQLRQQKKLERDVKMMEQRLAEDANRRAYQEMHRQAEELKSVYPDFDLDTELMNPEFTKLLRNGVSPRTAFEVIHKDEIIPAAMQWAVQQTQAAAAKAVAANASRPTENGISSQSAAQVKTDVSKLTREQLLEYRQRAMRGEKFSF